MQNIFFVGLIAAKSPIMRYQYQFSDAKPGHQVTSIRINAAVDNLIRLMSYQTSFFIFLLNDLKHINITNENSDFLTHKGCYPSLKIVISFLLPILIGGPQSLVPGET